MKLVLSQNFLIRHILKFLLLRLRLTPSPPRAFKVAKDAIPSDREARKKQLNASKAHKKQRREQKHVKKPA